MSLNLSKSFLFSTITFLPRELDYYLSFTSGITSKRSRGQALETAPVDMQDKATYNKLLWSDLSSDPYPHLAREKSEGRVFNFPGLLAAASTCAEVLQQFKERALRKAKLMEEDIYHAIEERTLTRKDNEFAKGDYIYRPNQCMSCELNVSCANRKEEQYKIVLPLVA